MGRLRVGVFADEKENGALRSSRPWDNAPDGNQGEDESTRFASLRVEHFVDVNIASRAAMFESSPSDTAPKSVADLAGKFESRSPQPLRQSDNGSTGVSSNSASATDEDMASSKPIIEPTIKTELGRRSVKPPPMNVKPIPFAMLPVPKVSPKSPSSFSEDAKSPILTDRTGASGNGFNAASPMKSSAAPMKTPTAESPLPPFRPDVTSPLPYRGHSQRCSIRASPARNSIARNSTRGSVRNSVRMSGASMIPRDFPPVSSGSSFLAFDENLRNSIPAPLVGVPTSITEDGEEPGNQQEYDDESDAESADTFGSLSEDEDQEEETGELTELQTPERAIGALPSLSHSGSEEAIFPEIKFDMGRRSIADDDEGDVLDIPRDLVSGADGGKALRELKCVSVTAGNELAEQVRQYAARSETQTDTDASTTDDGGGKDKVSRAQGELELRSRFFRRWNTRYASIVDHAYFGAVLFLFRHDAKASRQGTIALKNSKMIVLADSTVRELEPVRKNGPPSLFELRTAQRRYVFACIDDTSRSFWLKELSSFSS